jgi:hypothetical protein
MLAKSTSYCVQTASGLNMATASLPDHLNDNLTNTRGAIPLNEAFERLRWSVFENVSNILVLDGPKTQKPGLSPFDGHAIASRPASDIPLIKIAFSIDELNEFAALETGFSIDEIDEPGAKENLPYKREPERQGGLLCLLEMINVSLSAGGRHRLLKEQMRGKNCQNMFGCMWFGVPGAMVEEWLSRSRRVSAAYLNTRRASPRLYSPCIGRDNI